MNNYTKTVVSAVQAWTADQFKQSKPDWNQHDPNAADYIKNRTHYEKLETKILVDNLTREEYEKGNYPKLTFAIGNLYTVIWNGITYPNLECRYDHGYRVLGDPSQLYFAIGTDSRNNLFIASASGENYTVSIIGVISDIKTIDPKFLPEGIGYDTREEKIIFSAPLKERDQIYWTVKLSNTIENIYSSTNISINFPEYDFSVEKATIKLINGSYGELWIYCPEVDEDVCIYLENQLIADEFFNDWFRANEDDINPFTPGLYAWETPLNLSITLWNLSGELHIIDPKYLPDFQSDWNAVNPDSPNYINNKPFYDNSTPIIKNLTREDYYNDNYESVTFITGETYTVIWNGETYSNLICWNDGGDHVIGNEPGTPTLPFWIDDNGGNNGLDIDWMEEFENVTIYQGDGEIKQVDEKFLPILSKQESNNILIDNQIIETYNDYWIEFNEDLSFEINPQSKYTVIFNNVKYSDLIPWYDDNEEVYVIGSANVWYGYTNFDEPFACDGAWFGIDDIYDNYKLTIIEHNLVNKIDPKYLPDNGNASGGGTISANYLTLNDIDTNYEYIVAIKYGGLVSVCKGVELSIVKPPRQMQYVEGEMFNPEGMVLQLIRQDGTVSTITDCQFTAEVYNDTLEIVYEELTMLYTATLENIIVVPYYKANALIDFNYIYNPDTGMCQILSWKGTEYGSPSSVIRVPNEDYVIL